MKISQEVTLCSFLLFILLSGFSDSFSQPIVKTIINGLIVDSKSGKPVEGQMFFWKNNNWNNYGQGWKFQN